MNNECVTCQIKGLQKRMTKYGVAPEKQQNLGVQLEKYILELETKDCYSPEITRNILFAISEVSGISDPYRKEKDESNHELIKQYSEFKKRIEQSDDTFDTALRLAIAGNIIDFGPTHKFDVDGTIERVFTSDLAIDDSAALKAEIKKAKTILYLGDNCGEIVLDKLFLETINHSNVIFAVRDKPILNDATIIEATKVGIPEVAKLISNGDDAPSTLLHQVSTDFLEIYKSADLIISKGMGNFEGLMDETDSRLFYLLMVKCAVIGEKIGAEKGDFVVKRANMK